MVRLQVKGMSCQHCVRAVEGAIRSLDDASRVTVDLPSGTVEVDSTRLERDAIAAAIREEGYEVLAT